MPRRIEGPEGGFKRLPALRAEDLGGADYGGATITEMQDNIPVTDPSGRKKFKMRLRVAAFPERNFWPNATSRANLDKKLGRDTRGWVGARIVLEVVEVDDPNGVPTLSVWVADPKDWQRLIEADAAQPSPAPSTP
jgi:hypothetical protein